MFSNRITTLLLSVEIDNTFPVVKHVFSRRVDAINVLIYVDRTDKFSRYSRGSFESYCSVDCSHVAIKK